MHTKITDSFVLTPKMIPTTITCMVHVCGDMHKLSNLSSAKLRVLHFLFLEGL